jgi:hypothetical protein
MRGEDTQAYVELWRSRILGGYIAQGPFLFHFSQVGEPAIKIDKNQHPPNVGLSPSLQPNSCHSEIIKVEKQVKSSNLRCCFSLPATSFTSPLEILLRILKNYYMSNDNVNYNVLCNCSLVCRVWRSVAHSPLHNGCSAESCSHPLSPAMWKQYTCLTVTIGGVHHCLASLSFASILVSCPLLYEFVRVS